MDFEGKGNWNISFAGAGFMGLYHVGVAQCLQERAPRLLQGAHCVYGSSSGAIYATSLVCGMSVDFCCSYYMEMTTAVKRLSLGIFHPAFTPVEYIKQVLQENLPANAHILASQRLGISLTRWPDGKNIIVTNFATRDELIQAVICSMYIPFYCCMIPPEFRGERYLDGGLSNNIPFKDNEFTITVSPFPGTLDICPQSTSANMHEMSTFNLNLQISTMNVFLMFLALFPPSPEVVANICRQGYLDALRFLERRGLTKEQILWSLAFKAPPSPAEGAQDSGCNQEGKAGLTLNWAVPNVLVKDVPNFEQLSPALEAALRKACKRKPGLWVHFWQSGSGQVLTYLLLPCTFPVEYVYFQSKRVVEWFPDALADLHWMQEQLRGLAHGLYSRTKTQLFGPVRAGLDELPARLSVDPEHCLTRFSQPHMLRTCANLYPLLYNMSLEADPL
ncbi:PREDICTED: patatin-like phospholipase domain-containing protein 5 [Chrysochloris asiatica]|uniref:Patatin-like phospholipase domain-containing protein 5 n=1 Tax=Chrysochloris asiatica TaxID=185453 RepID=A0A9B0TKD3_CHRAS|nr:PREDICTED: patatin-like phospholipase domain-containing protein 5 [Chrysochloris asiatica]